MMQSSMRQYQVTNRDFVCPNCFKHVENCTCAHRPTSVIWVDCGIQDQVRILNEKGYKTNFCCESHNQDGNMYISFAEVDGNRYKFDKETLPEGFELWDKKKSHVAISFMYKRRTTDEQFVVQKRQHLQALLEWCESLPPYEPSVFVVPHGSDEHRAESVEPSAAEVETTCQDYVCPRCYHQLEDCTCEWRPQYLQLVDRGLQEHARILKEKGYEICRCDESHDRHGEIVLAFLFDFNFDELPSLPQGFRRVGREPWSADSHESVVYTYPPNMSDEEFEGEKRRRLFDLLDWCRSLPPSPYSSPLFSMGHWRFNSI